MLAAHLIALCSRQLINDNNDRGMLLPRGVHDMTVKEKGLTLCPWARNEKPSPSPADF